LIDSYSNFHKIRYRKVPQARSREKWVILYGVWMDFKQLGKAFKVPASLVRSRFEIHVLGKTGKYKTVKKLCGVKKPNTNGPGNSNVIDVIAQAKMMELMADPNATVADVKKYQKLAYGEL